MLYYDAYGRCKWGDVKSTTNDASRFKNRRKGIQTKSDKQKSAVAVKIFLRQNNTC